MNPQYYKEEEIDAMFDSRLPYKVYTALLTQTGTNAPTAIVLENTLGGTIVWSRETQGQYVGTLANAFSLDCTIVFATTGWKGTILTNAFPVNINSISVETFSTTDSLYRVDDSMDKTTIEIRVYNEPT